MTKKTNKGKDMGDSNTVANSLVSALEHYMHGQEPEQLKCLFEPNKLTKRKRDNLVATVGRLQKAQARMKEGIVARG